MKFTLSYIFICLQVCLARNIKWSKNFLRIVGGRNATEGEFPYAVKLVLQSLAPRMRGNIFVCSGVVLTSRWTLTAGHCITSIEQAMISTDVVQTKAVIEYHPSPKGEVAFSEVVSTAVHPSVSLQTVKNDIGLLHTQPLLLAKYARLSPIDYATLIGQEVSVIGYGMMKRIFEDPPYLPQVLEVIVKECSETNHYPQMCFAPSCSAHTRDSNAICQGDSGGPAIHVSGVVSINSMTDIRNCGMYAGAALRRDRFDTGHDVGSATPVSPYIDWISNIINKENT